MSTVDDVKVHTRAAWSVPSVLEGVQEISESWLLFAPDCEPFWSDVCQRKLSRKVPTAQRGIVLAVESAKPSIVFVPNRQLNEVLEYAKDIRVDSPLVLVVEDHPVLAPQLFPRESAKQVGISVIEPCDSTEVKICANAAATFSSSLNVPVILLMHQALLASCYSEEVVSDQNVHPRSSQAESNTPISLARRLELNRQRTLPSPGEQAEVGFVTIGGSDLSLKYLVSELQLLGRVPMLNFRLVSPIDHVPVERFLSRCRHVVVLEPRPGEVEQEIVKIAQSMRRDGREVATIWGRELPPFDPNLPAVRVPLNAIHPSVVARLTQHLLHDACPSANVGEQLAPQFPELDVTLTKRVPFGTNGALNLLRQLAIHSLCANGSDFHVVIDGDVVQLGKGNQIYIETWGEKRFVSNGINVIRDAVARDETRVFLVWRNNEIGSALLTLVEAVLPSKNDDGKRVQEVTIDQGEEVEATIEAASKHKGVTVIIVSDGEEPHFDLSRLSSAAQQIDKLGFRPQHAIVIPIEQMTPVRLVPIDPWKLQAGSSAMPLETSMSTKWLEKGFSSWRLSLRPILERVEVTRTKPPVRVVEESTTRLPPPKVLHGSSAAWRVHIAGVRGNQPGVVGTILMQAGMQMGYEVRAQCNNRFVGPDRRAWAQLLFTRKQASNTYRPLLGAIPWGEADVIFGWDKEEFLRAINQQGNLRVGSSDRTYAIINNEPIEHQTSFKEDNSEQNRLDEELIKYSCRKDGLVLRGFASLARYRFHNERLGDIVQLGMAFQLGYIPVTVDAMHAAISESEKNGFARSLEAFDFGRKLAVDPDSIWHPIKDSSQIDLDRLEKRCVRDLRKHGRRGVAQAVTLKHLLLQCRQSLPGLFETVDGCQSMVDLFNALRRCMLWGGEPVAIRFVNLICQVYVVDKPENGRALTRNVILPLAESILIREPIYLARLARSPEVVRRIRKRLNVRHSRGDKLKRRFLSRLKLRLWKWSLQIDLRTSDWSSVLVSTLGGLVPRRWRGHRRDRAVRELVIHAVNKAVNTKEEHEDWVHKFQELHKIALDGTLHSTSVEEVKEIIS
jgi:Pyruvate/2-oxoacid:ferredoxin oxidoreductase gamma subunit